MLTATRSAVVALAVLACAAAIALVAVTSSPAHAENGCPDGQTRTWLGGGQYSACVPISGTTPSPGTPGNETGEPAQPLCNLEYNEGAYLGLSPDSSGNYCKGTRTCFNVAHFTPNEMPEGKKPNEDSEARIEYCFETPFTAVVERIYWTDDEEEPPSLLEQAQTAIGQIDLPTPTLAISPPTRTLVNLDTWFWLSGAQRVATGSSAFGLVAIATFSSLTVDPGDGSGEFHCDSLPTTAAEAQQSCHHEYRKASTSGSATADGQPAYAASARSVYTLRFEVNGVPTPIPGAPTTLDGPSATAAVRVIEAQTLVRPNR
ncbi:hypothetical protein [Aeromicrobium wangtongii]|uniref:hypothetical protein n=1 Tax=Aeromicrobium wangtongii TaxID=2969247 RepID=UPI002018224B|nr:hypothetical protein [Aeromicrobium wangtongii]MCL3818867.1 hypothetical protein [Aeromicrobium wangtongii]